MISLYMVIFLLSITGVSAIWKFIGIIGMLSINLSIVHLYSSIIELLQNKFDKEIYEKENQYKKAQIKVMQDSLQATKQLRHNKYGIGFKSIEEMVKKRQGKMNIEHSNGIFKIKIAM